jgi:hypothetical protein
MAGKIIADQIEHSTAGSLDTSYVVNGSAKARTYYNQDTSTVLSSLNVSSVTDAVTGLYDLQYASSMSSGNYSCFRMSQAEATNFDCTFYAYSKATGSVRCADFENGTNRDMANTDAIIFGDLA